MKLPNKYNVWRHKRTGNTYTIVCISNVNADIERINEYPITVSYRSNDGFIWSRKLGSFLNAFEEIT